MAASLLVTSARCEGLEPQTGDVFSLMAAKFGVSHRDLEQGMCDLCNAYHVPEELRRQCKQG